MSTSEGCSPWRTKGCARSTERIGPSCAWDVPTSQGGFALTWSSGELLLTATRPGDPVAGRRTQGGTTYARAEPGSIRVAKGVRVARDDSALSFAKRSELGILYADAVNIESRLLDHVVPGAPEGSWPSISNALTGVRAKEISKSRFPVFPNFLGLVLGCIEAKFCK